MIATHSPWDSEVFGYRVGILHAKPPAHAYDIRNANKGKFDVVFVKFDVWVDPDGSVDALDYLYDMERLAVNAGESLLVSKVVSNAKHLSIARTSFQDSRFLRDPKLRQSVPYMYTTWLGLKEVYVLREDGDNAFLLEDKDSDGTSRISLVAVNENSRKRGLGRLLASCVLWTSPAWRVKVSCRNYQAIRFYENLGFRTESVHTAFHVWI
jgi:ribosomal protein S18 acetylase RimI-like enzyme